ncbi:hypothetical protein KUF71_023745 [Frankliniella fusca]|uniref:Uncharacterized protein n=1 Tax=Frankliniella fusca TaxID=407009 RepID=A0AAE1LD51_9NEOP|nr:hypothetical protein KUF71_023745 [Frankliniella fusca]
MRLALGALLLPLLAAAANGYGVNKFPFLMPNVRPTVVSGRETQCSVNAVNVECERPRTCPCGILNCRTQRTDEVVKVRL